MLNSVFPFNPRGVARQERIAVVALVVIVHLLAAMFWMARPDVPHIVVNEMSVSVAMQQADVSSPPTPAVQPSPIQPAPRLEPIPKIVHDEPVVVEPELAERVPEPAIVAPASPKVQPAVVAPVADVEPDYKAAYLNNPRPNYPMVARRMGWQGRVVLNVEVLESGLSGQIRLHQSSGHEVLDNAAINAVKGWRFVPGRQSGRVSAQWVNIPIPFTLKDSEA